MPLCVCGDVDGPCVCVVMLTAPVCVQGGGRPVRVLHFTDWAGDLPGSASDLLHLADTLRTDSQDDAAPVLVQCL